jgi:hypothetical protein
VRYAVEDYRLPDGANPLDRGTLIAWKVWFGWIRPILLLAALMVIAHLIVGWLAGVPSRDASSSPYRYLVRWRSYPAAPLVSPSYDGTIYGQWVLWWSIGAQMVAAATGAVAGWFPLRQSRRPVTIGALGGLVAVVVHVSFAGLWTVHPLGDIGSAGIAVTVPSSVDSTDVHIYVGTLLQNALGSVALWSPIAFGALVGGFVRRRPVVR